MVSILRASRGKNTLSSHAPKPELTSLDSSPGWREKEKITHTHNRVKTIKPFLRFFIADHRCSRQQPYLTFFCTIIALMATTSGCAFR